MANKTMKTLTIGDNIYEIVDEIARIGVSNLNTLIGNTSVASQIASKQDTITGGATTITNNNLTTSRALISNSNGKVAVSDITSVELGCLDGVTSNVQTQLNNKLSLSGGTNLTSGVDLNSYTTVGTYIAPNSTLAKSLVNSPHTSSGFKLFVIDGYIAGRVTQLVTTNTNDMYYRQYSGTTWDKWAKFYTTDNTPSLSDLGITVTTTELNYMDGVTSNIQTQLSKKASTINYSATLDSRNWSDNAPYTQTITVEGILATDTPIIDVDMNGVTTSDGGTVLLDAWGCVGRITTATNQITAYCYDEMPVINIPVIIKVVR